MVNYTQAAEKRGFSAKKQREIGLLTKMHAGGGGEG